jgi:hypothetical protein
MKSKAGLLDLDAERSAWAELSEQATYPRDWRPVFPEWWKNGAPGRIRTVASASNRQQKAATPRYAQPAQEKNDWPLRFAGYTSAD